MEENISNLSDRKLKSRIWKALLKYTVYKQPIRIQYKEGEGLRLTFL